MKITTKLGAISALLFIAASASATTIKAGYTVHTNDGSGLTTKAANMADSPFTVDLNAGESKSFILFTLYTDDTQLSADAGQPQPISVDFDFLTPVTGNASITGQTYGAETFGAYDQGHVFWDGPADFSYGPNNDGLIEIGLLPSGFNFGVGQLEGGKANGATISATVSLIRDASPADVPEPNTTALFALALAGLGFITYRRRQALI